MNVDVDYDQLYLLGIQAEKEIENIEIRIKNLNKILEDFAECWEGSSYEEFKGNASVTLHNLNDRLKDLMFLATFCKYAADVYSNNDSRWGKQMKLYGEDNLWQERL